MFENVLEFRQYYWLISNLEYNYCTDPRLQTDPVIIDGNTLYEIVQKEKIQFIWAVLSGFRKEITSIPKELPFACGNRNLWVGSPKPQAQGAEVELVCWDSTCTLFIGVNKNVALKLETIYPDIRDLDKENKTRG